MYISIVKMKFPIELFHSTRQLESALPKIEAKCCHEDNQHRDYEYSESSSRHQAIFKSSTHLSHPLALTDTCLDHRGLANVAVLVVSPHSVLFLIAGWRHYVSNTPVFTLAQKMTLWAY